MIYYQNDILKLLIIFLEKSIKLQICPKNKTKNIFVQTNDI